MQIRCKQCRKMVGEGEGRFAWVCPRCSAWNRIVSTNSAGLTTATATNTA